MRLDQRQADLALFRVDLDDPNLDLLTDLDDLFGVLDLVISQLGDVQEPFQTLLELDEHAEVGDLRDGPRDAVTNVVTRRDIARPRVSLQLLEAKRDPLLLLIDGQDDALDLVALLHDFGRVRDLLGPRHVRDVQESVDAFLQLDERAVVRQVADAAADDGPWRVVVGHHVPGVHLDLLHAEADLLLLLVDLQHDDLDVIAHVDDLARVVDSLGPGHLGDVHQPLDAVLQLDEGAVGHEVDHLAGDPGTDGVLLLDVLPRRRQLLLHAEGDTLALAIDLEDLDLHLLVDAHHLGRVVAPTPGHIGDVEQTVDPAEVDEHAEVGDVLDLTGAQLALLDLAHQLGLELLAVLLDQLAARDDDVHPLLIDLDDAGVDLLADPLADVTGAADVHLRGREEHRHADVDQQAALDLALDLAVDDVAFLVRLDDAFPAADAVGLALAERDEALRVLDVFHQGLDLEPWDHRLGIGELVDRDTPLGLVSNVDDDRAVFEDAKDLALHDLVRGDVVHRGRHGGVELTNVTHSKGLPGEPIQLLRVHGELLHKLFTVHLQQSGLRKNGHTQSTTIPTRAGAEAIGPSQLL